MQKIALEEHFTTPELSGYAVGPNSSLAASFFRRFEERLLEFQTLRLEAMDKAGIEVAVLSVTTPGVQGEKDAGVAIKLAKQANDCLAHQIEKQPTRYRGFAHLPMQDAIAAADEIERCIRELGFKGAMINGHTNGRYLDDEFYYPFWERVEALHVPVYLHPCDLYDGPRMFEGRPELLGATWSWTVETATHALRLVFGGTFNRFPNAILILGHMGETLPYLLWRFDSRTRIQQPENNTKSRPPSEIIKRNIVITTTGVCSHPSLLCALSALGEDSVMFSVDYPYEDCSVASDFIKSAPISEKVRAKVCHGNAERLLGL